MLASSPAGRRDRSGIDGTGGGDLGVIAGQVAAAGQAGYDGVWTSATSSTRTARNR